MLKIERSIPFFIALLKSQKSMRMKILQSFPSYVIDDLIEIIVRIVRGDVNVTEGKKQIMRKHRKSLLTLVNTKSNKLKRSVMNKQHGGFIAALLPIALAALGLTHFK